MKKILTVLGVFLLGSISSFLFMHSFAKEKTAKKTESTVIKTKDGEYTDPNKMIQITPNQSIVTLKIKSNPTTGYMWFLNDYDSALLTPVSRKYVPSKSDLAGAGGYEEWKFRIKSKAFSVPQLTKINLRYIRPWVVSESTQQLDFTVAIEPKAVRQK